MRSSEERHAVFADFRDSRNGHVASGRSRQSVAVAAC